MPELSLEQRLAAISERQRRAGRGGWWATAENARGECPAQVWGDDNDPIAWVHASCTARPDSPDHPFVHAGDIAAFIAASHADVGALVAVVEAALSTGLWLTEENAAGLDEPTRKAMCEGAAMVMSAIRARVSEALEGHTEGDNP